MAVRNRIDRIATPLLFVALAVALTGVLLQRAGGFSRFWTGLIVVIGEAALVGGLADWFAVRALFVHPMGVRLPHTALVPRNRPRIVKEIRNLILEEWLTREMVRQRVADFDFAGQVPALLEGAKPHLRDVLRTVARDVLADVSPEWAADFLACAIGKGLDRGHVVPFLTEVVGRAREEVWVEPLLHEWLEKFKEWAGSADCRALVREQLEQAVGTYGRREPWKQPLIWWARLTGGLNLGAATVVVQEQIRHFADSQLADRSQLNQLVHDWLEKDLEQRLRQDPEFAGRIEDLILRALDARSLTALLTPLVASLRTQGLEELKDDGSALLAGAVGQIGRWVDRLMADPGARDRVNAWCRQEAINLVERHHSVIGDMVEVQLNRLSDERLVQMIEERVGDDLNWIRINGTVVGCLVGVLIYLLFSLIERAFS